MKATMKQKKAISPERSELYKRLFNAAKWCVDPDYRYDSEAVRVKRDQACYEMYDKYYDELTNDELEDVIASLRVQSGFQEEYNTKIYATKKQIKDLKYYGLSCALVYCNLENCSVYDNELCETYSGEYLRSYLIRKFDENKGWIPSNIFSHIHRKWLNPKCHKFLIEGGFKKFSKNDETFYYEYLKPQEANHLIKRFQAIYQNIEMKRGRITNQDFRNN